MMTSRHLLIPLVAIGAIHCATTNNAIVWQGDDEFVQVVEQDLIPNGITPRNDHPADLTSAAIDAALESLRIVHERKGNPLVLFGGTRRRLAPHLSRALSQAKPTEDVVFAARTWGRGPMFGKSMSSVACRIFVLDDKLHVIVGDLFEGSTHEALTASGRTQTKIDRRIHPHKPGKRSVVRKHKYSLLTGDGVAFFETKGEVRPDWVVIDLKPEIKHAGEEELRLRPAPEATPEAGEPGTKGEAGPGAEATPEAVTPTETTTPGEATAPGEATTEPPAPGAPAPDEEAAPNSKVP